MSEYIKKSELLKANEDAWNGVINVDESGSYIAMENEGMIDSLPTYSFPNSAENKGEWIPVTERLPEEVTKVYLACCDDGYVSAIMYSGEKWLIAGSNIIAWMPLPEPYKAESEDKE